MIRPQASWARQSVRTTCSCCCCSPGLNVGGEQAPSSASWQSTPNILTASTASSCLPRTTGPLEPCPMIPSGRSSNSSTPAWSAWGD
eukprot:scaffold147336_cov32-Tisochrysis_lutea.AAC.1